MGAAFAYTPFRFSMAALPVPGILPGLAREAFQQRVAGAVYHPQVRRSGVAQQGAQQQSRPRLISADLDPYA
ncbi:hypothetical protein GCM10010840_33290 [Deinococcus aerolatus]|uniref:Uncharacterized protein n=2 Tax=Deinococcus aerolatus TaxID=522487 RepID=A0ABQ2GFJ4_9DEIO|nr:hypothetical protein GCM10010840_33290 [Deinococcus aerolatus]